MFKNWGKRNKYGTAPKRIDRTQTRQPFLDDSDEESLASTTSVSCSESDFESYPSGSDASGDSDSAAKRKSAKKSTKKTAKSSDSKSSDSTDDSSESEEEKVVPRKGRKRPSKKALNDSSSDSDSEYEAPVRKTDSTKKFKRIKTDEDTKRMDAKRKERQRKLAELVQKRKQGVSRQNRRRRASPGDSEDEEPEKSAEAGEEKEGEKDDKKKEEEENKEKEDDSEEEDAAPTMKRSSDEESDDSLKDFIVEDEKAPTGDEAEDAKDSLLAQLPSQFITKSPLFHFQVVVKSFLINVLDENFLESLYSGERTKRYAQEMKDSLLYFDERLVLPRLENLKLRSRWKERYKDRVECYPEVSVKLTESVKRCEACELDRTGRFNVTLSGQLYHAKTLLEDQFMPEDKQRFCVGSVCANRTEVYHALKHFKYHLFVGCRKMIEEHTKKMKDGGEQGEKGEEEEPVKETVKKVFASLLQNGWINEQYDSLQEHLNKADFFQEEKLD
ncbi:coiled-coil domain-containing protein 82 [Engraulis encrasicolus]|uniref:coiled-coil domain-containing protein 82 n=1 Tax=Engraulis encrasicolus TaxID=184585 RepID=UPI002FD412F7